MTQSNVIVAVETGIEDLTAVKRWMHSTLGPIYREEKGTFIFRGDIWYMQLK